MITLERDRITFRFPEIDPDAHASVAMMRTLRLPDDGKTWPLPPGLGTFPLRHLDDFASRLPEAWRKRGGLIAPMAQAEAMWLNFSSREGLPVALRICTGKIDAVTGEAWSHDLSDDPQNYVVLPNQPWLDGYKVASDAIRQFVAMPLGEGYTAEEQITGAAEHGGLQFLAYPMKKERWEAIKREREEERRRSMARMDSAHFEDGVAYSMAMPCAAPARAAAPMGLSPGGRMKQKIFADRYGIDAWDTSRPSKLFVTLLNSLQWRAITGEDPPPSPATAERYTQAGLPWYDYYAGDETALATTDTLKGLKSVNEIADGKGELRPAESAGTLPPAPHRPGARPVREFGD